MLCLEADRFLLSSYNVRAGIGQMPAHDGNGNFMSYRMKTIGCFGCLKLVDEPLYHDSFVGA
jgi:hypothetical protein